MCYTKIMKCWNAEFSVVSGSKMQVGYGSGNFRKSRVGSIRIESGNANENYIKFHNGDINKHR